MKSISTPKSVIMPLASDKRYTPAIKEWPGDVADSTASKQKIVHFSLCRMNPSSSRAFGLSALPFFSSTAPSWLQTNWLRPLSPSLHSVERTCSLVSKATPTFSWDWRVWLASDAAFVDMFAVCMLYPLSLEIMIITLFWLRGCCVGFISLLPHHCHDKWKFRYLLGCMRPVNLFTKCGSYYWQWAKLKSSILLISKEEMNFEVSCQNHVPVIHDMLHKSKTCRVHRYYSSYIMPLWLL